MAVKAQGDLTRRELRNQLPARYAGSIQGTTALPRYKPPRTKTILGPAVPRVPLPSDQGVYTTGVPRGVTTVNPDLVYGDAQLPSELAPGGSVGTWGNKIDGLSRIYRRRGIASPIAPGNVSPANQPAQASDASTAPGSSSTPLQLAGLSGFPLLAVIGVALYWAWSGFRLK